MSTRKSSSKGATRKAASPETDRTRELAELISAVMNRPDLPERLEEYFHEGLNELFNMLSGAQQHRVEYNPAHLALLLAEASASEKGGARR